MPKWGSSVSPIRGRCRRSGLFSCWEGTDYKGSASRLLGQIDAPRSSRALAMIALTSQSSIARRDAVKILKGRNPRDYAAVLIVLFRDPIKYDVQPVNGPGSQGELLVKSEDV